MKNSFENMFSKKEWIERCPHCGEKLGENHSTYEEKDKRLGTLKITTHKCAKCGESTILDREIVK